MQDVLEKPGVRSAVRLIGLEEYRRLFAGEKTELLAGVVVTKMSKSKLHAGVLRMLYSYMTARLPDKFEVIKEDPLTLGDSEPEPDLAVVAPRLSIHDEHPTFAHLVVEVSVTTQQLDADKADIYAAGGIPLYWNLLPLEELTVVYSDASPEGYRRVARIPFNESLRAEFDGIELQVRLAEILK